MAERPFFVYPDFANSQPTPAERRLHPFQAADRMAQQSKKVRMFVFQTNKKPHAFEVLTPAHQERVLPFYDLGEVNPHRIVTGEFNFATLHWEKGRYIWEYVANGNTDEYRRVTTGNLPSYAQGYGYNYFAIVEITAEMQKKAIGLPKVPWEK